MKMVRIACFSPVQVILSVEGSLMNRAMADRVTMAAIRNPLSFTFSKIKNYGLVVLKMSRDFQDAGYCIKLQNPLIYI